VRQSCRLPTGGGDSTSSRKRHPGVDPAGTNQILLFAYHAARHYAAATGLPGTRQLAMQTGLQPQHQISQVYPANSK